jgi:hypothetical protein
MVSTTTASGTDQAVSRIAKNSFSSSRVRSSIANRPQTATYCNSKNSQVIGRLTCATVVGLVEGSTHFRNDGFISAVHAAGWPKRVHGLVASGTTLVAWAPRSHRVVVGP